MYQICCTVTNRLSMETNMKTSDYTEMVIMLTRGRLSLQEDELAQRPH